MEPSEKEEDESGNVVLDSARWRPKHLEDLIRLALRAGDESGVISATRALGRRRAILRARMKAAKEAGSVAAEAEEQAIREAAAKKARGEAL